MAKEKRKSRRRMVSVTALLLPNPAEGLTCHLTDISDTGARLDVEDPGAVPNRFLLWLSRKGRVYRACEVVWRSKRQIGVKFDKEHVLVQDGSDADVAAGAA
jgi:hypothetical protein